MSYEYKETIADLLEYHVYSESEELRMQSELEHVYTQAPKADEYEAKAKAFDEIMKIMKACGVPDRLDWSECPREIQEFYEYHESGESDD